MWEIILCPKCGVRLEMNLSDLTEVLVCTHCFEKFTLPYDVRARLDEKTNVDLAVLSYTSESHLDSSFWIS